MSRNRVIYQSKALFIAPNATGIQAVKTGSNPPTSAATASYTAAEAVSATGLLYKLDRVQNCIIRDCAKTRQFTKFINILTIDGKIEITILYAI